MREFLDDDPHSSGFHYALGDTNGTVTLHLAGSADFNSMLTMNTYGSERLPPAICASKSETVEVRRLADIVDDVTLGLPSDRIFLKVDTQGFDLRIGQGALPILRIVAIQTEVATKAMYEGAPNFTEHISFPARLRYEVAGFFPVTRDSDGVRAIGIDCVIILTDQSSLCIDKITELRN